MVKMIVARCNVCLKDQGAFNDAVGGETITVGNLTKEVDCCEDHLPFLTELINFLERFGEDPPSVGEVVRAERRAEARNATLKHRCPVCEKRYASRSSLRTHTERVHSASVGELERRPQTWVCELCEAKGQRFEASAPQGLGAHKKKRHGVTGTSSTATKRRTTKESADDATSDQDQTKH